MSQIEITPPLLNDLRQNAEAANPAVMLALVAEIERLRSFQAVAVQVIDKLNNYHECSDPDQCRSCEQINAGIELISKAKREANNAD